MDHREEHEAIRVFLISPHRCIAWGLERLIESRQPAMKVVGAAASCAEAHDRLSDCSAHVVLLDLHCAGEQTGPAISTLLRRSAAKIVVLTGLREESIQREAVFAGASGIVRKEHAGESILAAIETVHEGQLWLDRTAMSQILSAQSCGRAATSNPDRAIIEVLTRREKEIVALAAGHPAATLKTLAGMLAISERTLGHHLTSIYEKLDISNRVELFAYSHNYAITRLGARHAAGR